MSESKSLFLIATALQARYAHELLKLEKISCYDLVYITYRDSDEDFAYYNLLAADADVSDYICIAERSRYVFRLVDGLFKIREWLSSQCYDVVFLSSLGDHLLSTILSRKKYQELVTFDDGTANLRQADKFFKNSKKQKEKLLVRLLGTQGVGDLKKSITRHYTMHADLPNIVDSSLLRPVLAWREYKKNKNTNNCVTFFIGQPFSLVTSSENVEKLKETLKNFHVDYYVAHPGEKERLDELIPMLKKQGELAEDAILRVADGRPIRLIGWFSTVMFNLRYVADENKMFLFENDERTEKMIDLAKRIGCEVELI